MRKIILALGVCSVAFFSANAQDSRFPGRGCGTMEEDARMRAENPELGTLDEFEQWMEQKIAENKVVGAANKVKTVYTIPVIVHVIHTGQAIGTGYNISLAQINSQIDVLNKDFRKLNSDTGLIPAIFKPAAADCEINFCMAKVDPNGIPLAVPGVDRINASSKGWSIAGLTNTYITSTIKTASIWNTNKYMNVWVVPDYTDASGNPLLGYATFPAGSTLSGITSTGNATSDGFVCWYKSFGSVGNLDPSYNKGRTATHEIGHWLGLRHVWGDNGGCQTDYCADTPISETANYGCKSHPFNIGGCSGNTTGEMFMNYMDYSDDNCLYLFTNNQKTRAQTVMANSPMRIAQAASTTCNPVLTAGDDAAPMLITSPSATSCVSSFTAGFTLVNYGTTPLTSCTFNYSLDGGAVSTAPWTGNIASPGIALAQLPLISGTPTFSVGTHILKIYTTNPNGVTDANTANDTLKLTFTITNPTGTAITSASAFSQSFPNSPFSAAVYPGWSLVNPNGGSPTWSQTTTAGGFGNSPSCLKMSNFSATVPNPNNTQTDDFTTPVFDFSGGSPYYLNFNVAYARKSAAYSDSLSVYISTDCEASWTKIYGKTQSALATNGGASVTSAFTPTAAQWRSESVDISSYQGNTHVKFKFRNKNGGGNNIYIDDINVATTPPLGVIANESLQNAVVIYPNPSHGIFSISTNFVRAADLKINIIDVLGNVVYSNEKPNFKTGIIDVDLSHLAGGVYFVEVKTNKEKATKRISIIE